MAKTFVIGDVHGAYKALEQVLERAGVDKDVDTVISLGDIADGWSQVPQCVELLLSIKNLIAVRGNHDDWCLQWMQFRIKNDMWLTQGGQATYDAYTIYHPDLIDKHQKEFFEKQHYYYHDKDNNRVFVHGGYVDAEGIGHDRTGEYMWDRELWMIALSGQAGMKGDYGDQRLPKRLRPHKEIYIGHTATTKWNETYPMNACNVWNMDTGAGWSGKLSIMDVETKEIWQSDLVEELYPDEDGRRKAHLKKKMVGYKRRL